MPTLPFFYEWEITDSHRNIFIVKTQSLFADLSDKLISNKFSGVNREFLIGTYALKKGLKSWDAFFFSLFKSMEVYLSYGLSYTLNTFIYTYINEYYAILFKMFLDLYGKKILMHRLFYILREIYFVSSFKRYWLS